jgi:hypothetical protein
VAGQFAGELVDVGAFEVIKLLTVEVENSRPNTIAMRCPLLSNMASSMRLPPPFSPSLGGTNRYFARFPERPRSVFSLLAKASRLLGSLVWRPRPISIKRRIGFETGQDTD